MTELETPSAVRKLEESVRSDLAKVTALFGEGVSLLEGLEETLAVLPATQSRIRGWLNQVGHVIGQVGEEQADVSRKLLGRDDPTTISENVNEAHAANVLALRKEA